MSQSNPPQDPESSTERLDQATRAFVTEHDEPTFEVLYLAAVGTWSEVARKMKVAEHDLGEIVGIVGAAMWNQRENFRGSNSSIAARRDRRCWRMSWPPTPVRAPRPTGISGKASSTKCKDRLPELSKVADGQT